MNPAGTIISAFGTDDWDAQVYSALSVASGVAASIKNRTNVLRIAYSLRGLNKTLGTFLDKVHGAMEGKTPPIPHATPPTPQQLRSMADNLEHLHRTIEYVYESLRRAGLANNSLAAGPLHKMREHGESVLDLADWLEVAAQPKEVNEIFNRAKQEKERGELLNLAQVK